MSSRPVDTDAAAWSVYNATLDGMDGSARLEALADRLERVAEIEAQIDPKLRRRGRILADVVTIVVLTPFSIAFDLHVTHPLGMLALMGGALALNHLVPRITERRLRAERKRLLSGAGVARSP